MSLAIPDAVAGEIDSMAAAFCYVKAGLYVGPLLHGGKRPGSVLGDSWPSKTFNDPESVAAWYAGTSYGVFLHAGRSGLVVLDVDRPEKIPADWWPHLSAAPFQSTRQGDARRGHYVFAMPPGRLIGNPNIPGGAGEVRGANGVIVVAPTRHEKAAHGGQYAWVRTGPVPVLPALITALLPEGQPGESAATDEAVAAFLRRHTGNAKPHLASAPVERFAVEQQDGSRHEACLSAACWIAREAAAGLYPAREAFDELGDAFEAAIAGERPARAEFAGIVAWAVGQVSPGRIAAVQAKHGGSAAESAESAQAPDQQVSASTVASSLDAESAESKARVDLAANPPRDLGRREPLPAFPLDVLPGWCADMVAAVAESMQVPTDSPGAVCLGALATAAGGRVEVRPRRDWTEPCNLYVLVTAGSSERKSPVLRVLRAPVKAAERQLLDGWRPAAAEAAILRDVAAKQAESARAVAAKTTGEGARKALAEAIGAAASADRIVVPPAPRLLAGGDATPEALTKLLSEHGGRISVWDAEGGLFDTLAGRYSNSVPNLDAVLQAYSGDPISVERRGREPEQVERPALTLVLLVQPLSLARVTDDPQMVGRGLAARFIYAMPESLVGTRKTGRDVTPIPQSVEDAYTLALGRLTVDLADWTDPAVLQFTDEALGVLDTHEATTERRLGPGGDLAATGAWGGKHDGRTVRFAGLLHLAALGATRGIRSAITPETMTAAVRLANYYAEHGKAALVHRTDDTSAARAVLDHLRRRDLDAFTIRQLVTDLPRGKFPDKDAVADAVDELERCGWVAMVPAVERRGAGRKPSPRYVVHPDASPRRRP